MNKLISLTIGITLILTFAAAQMHDEKSGRVSKLEPPADIKIIDTPPEPCAGLPKNYKCEFENERVRVTRAHYAPHEIIESHEHPRLPTVYVYLNTSGPVRFTHTGDEKFTVVRPAVKAGGFRVSRPVIETHKVESLSAQPTDFLRIELKNLTVDADFRGRFPPEKNQTVKNSEKVSFENRQLRIVRVTCARHSACPLPVQTLPYLVVALTSSKLKTAVNSEVLSDLEMKAGQTVWVASNNRFRLENPGNALVRFLLIEFKTAN